MCRKHLIECALVSIRYANLLSNFSVQSSPETLECIFLLLNHCNNSVGLRVRDGKNPVFRYLVLTYYYLFTSKINTPPKKNKKEKAEP